MAIDRLNTLLQMGSDENIITLPINKLDSLEDTPFKIYDGEKKEKLIESIKESGVMIPIIVTPKKDSRGHYTILSGANRVDASIKLGLEEIQAIVKTDLTEDEYMLIVVETNLFNRSIDDMLPSELAKSLLLRQQAMKHQGKRTDLLTSGTMCQKSKDGNEMSDTTSGTLYQKLNSEYKLSERNIRNYIRLNYLNKELLDYVDNKVISFRAGVELSYLKNEEQNELSMLIKTKNYHIQIDAALMLKQLSAQNIEPLNIEEELINHHNKAQKKQPFIKIPLKEINEFIHEEDLPKAKTIMIEALKLYYELNS